MAKLQTPDNGPPADLLSLGFEEASNIVPRRLLVASDGLEKSGKSNLWLTAPGPIAGINLDIGLEGVIHRYTKNKKIWMVNYNVPPISNQKDYISHFQSVKKAYEAAVNHKDVRTVVIDTGSDMWDLVILAEFGVLNPTTSKGSLAFTTANSVFRGLIKMVYDTDKNLIMTHKISKEWAKGSDGKNAWTGGYERDGFRGSGYLIQVNVRHAYDPVTQKFSMKIVDCRQEFSLSGFELGHDECNFPSLASTVFPETTPADWK